MLIPLQKWLYIGNDKVLCPYLKVVYSLAISRSACVYLLVMHRYHFFPNDPIPIHLRPEMADTDTLPHRHFSQESASDLAY